MANGNALLYYQTLKWYQSVLNTNLLYGTNDVSFKEVDKRSVYV